MKKKNEQWLRYSNRALSGLLMLFGFVSCDNGGGDIPVEYGMPSAKYRVKGKVIDADTQEPVSGHRSCAYGRWQRMAQLSGYVDH